MIHPHGLYGKYHVTKVADEEVDDDAQYFVLRYDTDPHARIAMRAYAASVEASNPKLAYDLRGTLADNSHLKGGKLEEGNSGAMSKVPSNHSAFDWVIGGLDWD